MGPRRREITTIGPFSGLVGSPPHHDLTPPLIGKYPHFKALSPASALILHSPLGLLQVSDLAPKRLAVGVAYKGYARLTPPVMALAAP